MTLLALDTATERPSLALGEPGGRGEQVDLGHRHELSGSIEIAVARLLDSRGLASRELAGVLVADGPGSFTGLRIGVAFTKGLCRAAGLPMLTAPSLLGSARAAASGPATVVAEYDALRGEVYRAVYRFLDGEVETLVPPTLAPALPPVALPGLDPDRLVRAGPRHASALALLRLVGIRGGALTVGDPAQFEPDYGRPAEAEARLRARGGAP